MSDTAAVMKGCRSGVQKLIRDEIPHLYDVGCIFHLADLAIKAGISKLPINIRRSAIHRHILSFLSQ